MSEFVDKVAKAIIKEAKGCMTVPFAHALARAAISAMEPTPEMVEAGDIAGGISSRDIWNAMRAAALADEKETG